MDLVLQEEVRQGSEKDEEAGPEELSVIDGLWVCFGAQCDAAYSPRHSSDQVRNHKDVVPVMVVCRSDVSPSSAA